MINQWFILLMLIHIIGDFYFQTDSMAEQKNNKLLSLFKHSSIYLGVALLFCIPIISTNIIFAIVGLAFSHFIIDVGKFMMMKTLVKKSRLTASKKAHMYVVDQLLHILCIFAIGTLFVMKNININTLSFVRELLNVLNLNQEILLKWILVILLIWKPVNVTIKQLLSAYKPPEADEMSAIDTKRAGAFIGVLERLIILMFLSIGQYSAIGLVLTAKSIARYSKITEDKEFAEYYLLGTLLSTLLAIASYLIVFGL